MAALQDDAETHGAMIAFSSQVLPAASIPRGLAQQIGGTEEIEIVALCVVNCAGLRAVDLTNKVEGLAKAHILKQRLTSQAAVRRVKLDHCNRNSSP